MLFGTQIRFRRILLVANSVRVRDQRRPGSVAGGFSRGRKLFASELCLRPDSARGRILSRSSRRRMVSRPNSVVVGSNCTVGYIELCLILIINHFPGLPRRASELTPNIKVMFMFDY